MIEEAGSGIPSPPPTSQPEETGSGFRELETVFVGSWPEVLALQAALAARGEETFVADAMLKTIDPFITGGDVLGVRLQAPADRAKAVADAIRELRDGPGLPESAGSAIEEESAAPPEDEEVESPPDPRFAEVEALGARVRWASLVGVLAPIGLFHALRYLGKTPGLPRPPRKHGLTLAAICVCVLWTGLLLFMAILMFRLGP